MTREELIEAIVKAKLTPEERKARRKKWAKRAAVGVGAVAATGVAAHYGAKGYARRKDRKSTSKRVQDNIWRSRSGRRSHSDGGVGMIGSGRKNYRWGGGKLGRGAGAVEFMAWQRKRSSKDPERLTFMYKGARKHAKKLGINPDRNLR